MVEEQSLDELEWRSPEWINIYGLRTDNILEYFSLSPFWDRQCNNQILKMQRQFQIPADTGNPNLPPPMMIIPSFDVELRRLTGIEYVLHMIKEPDMWIIRKQRRISDGSNAFNKENNNKINNNYNNSNSNSNKANNNMTIEQYMQTAPGMDLVDDVVVLADYFCVGSKVYMASNVHLIARQGILSVTRALDACVDRLTALTSAATVTSQQLPSRDMTDTIGAHNNSNKNNELSLFSLSVRSLEKEKRGV